MKMLKCAKLIKMVHKNQKTKYTTLDYVSKNE